MRGEKGENIMHIKGVNLGNWLVLEKWMSRRCLKDRGTG